MIIMATTKFFLDCRRTKENQSASLKLAIRNANTTAYISLNIYLQPTQWSATECRVLNSYPMYRELNARLNRIKSQIDVEILVLSERENLKNISASELKNKILHKVNPDCKNKDTHSFISVFKEFMKLKSVETQGVYQQTLSRMNAFACMDKVKFEDISVNWLIQFDSFMSQTAPSSNARNIHLRNIRAVFNYALDNEYTKAYPFRRFKIHAEQTRKRSLSVEELREIFDYPVEDYAVIYRDMFKLIFMLVGINTVDLHRLTNIKRGRIEYRRAKTGRLYSIKVEPEAMKLIEKYKGEKGLLVIADRWTDHKNFRHQINKALQRIGKVERTGRGGKKIITPEWPELTTYWARHTWATIAADLDIPDAVISQALGHAGENSTTDIYIRRNQKKVDEANRKVLDWVLYGKR